MAKRVTLRDEIHRGNQGHAGPQKDLVELRLYLPAPLAKMFDAEVKRLRTNRAQLTRFFIREGLERLLSDPEGSTPATVEPDQQVDTT
jgi:hypothetical protein